METTSTTGTSTAEQRKKKRITLLDLESLLILVPGGRTVSVEDASDAEFESFIKQATEIVYSLEERRNMINSLLGKTLILDGDEVKVSIKEWKVQNG